jgi:uncharacterized protein involved in type VI secretion and phage assembly
MEPEATAATAATAEEQARNRYYGKYRGFVVDNADPEKRARLRLRVPSLLGETETGWALPCLPYGGLADQGLFLVPDVDAQLWVEFEEGNLDRPIWVGTFWQRDGDPPAEAAVDPPTTRVLKTASGHILQFDDAEGAEQFRLVHPAGAEMTVDKDGTVSTKDAQGAQLVLDAAAGKVELKDANGNVLTMDAAGTKIKDKNGNTVEMAASGITVKGQQIVIEGSSVAVGGAGGEPLIKGPTFLGLFATHVHTCTAPGAPTSPPIPQGEMSSLTTKTTAS